MSQKKLLVPLAVIVLFAGWYAFRPERLFINQTVDEAFDVESASVAGAPVAVLTGQFRSLAHESVGTATIHQAADGSRTLRLTDFATSNGPDVRIYLVAAADAPDNETVRRAGFVDLGAMKGNIGDQNYDVPADLDLDRYRAVTIWCRRFAVNFGTAPLGAAMAGGDPVEFRVRVENVSTAQTLRLSNGETAPAPTSPGVWAVYRGANPIFSAGAPAGANGLEALAEDGDPMMLGASLARAAGVRASGVYAVPLGDAEAGPLLPGKAFEFTLRGAPGDLLALAFMFGQSNDWFYANADGIELFDAAGRPASGDITRRLALWDAGTEVNQEPGLGPDQGPRQKGPDTGAAENGVVSPGGTDYPVPGVTQIVRVTLAPARS